MERQNEYVLRTVEDGGVRFVRLWFTDVLGFLKSVEITPAELQVALEEGMTFDGSTIEGYSRIQESDNARPARRQHLRAALDRRRRHRHCPHVLRHLDLLGRALRGRPPAGVEAQSRAGRAKRASRSSSDRRWSSSTSATAATVDPLDNAGYFDLTAHDLGSELRKQTVLRLEAMGIPVEYSFHENGPSQHEIDLRYTPTRSRWPTT